MAPSQELISYLFVLLLATPPGDGRCVRGDIVHLDGERITQESLTRLRRIESATGMHLGSETTLVTALERRGSVAVAMRAGVRIAEGDAFERLEYMKVESLRPRRLRAALDVAGERAYVRWVLMPLLSEHALHDVYRADLRGAGQARARYLLGQALARGDSLKAFASEGVEYITFPLSAEKPVIHAPPALQLDYERDMETWFATGNRSLWFNKGGGQQHVQIQRTDEHKLDCSGNNVRPVNRPCQR